jgi:gliding motility-associated lipoprotein GldH
MHKIAIICVLILGISMSCTQEDGLKEIRDFKDSEWAIAKPQVFEIIIKDISHPYTFRYLIRNAVQYPYYNLYLTQKLYDPSGRIVKGTTDEILLFDAKTGKPKGDGLGDMFDHKRIVPALKRVVFTVPGTYKWEITHNMRPDPLLGIMSIGAEVLKSE